MTRETDVNKRRVYTPPPSSQTEKIALDLAERYERSQGRHPVYVGDGYPPSLLDQVSKWVRERVGSPSWHTCDYVSLSSSGRIDRLIEVKGRKRTSTSVSLADRQLEAARALPDDWWLYVAFDCGTVPFLEVVNRAHRLPWKLLTPPKPLAPGKKAPSVVEEGVWHVMPAEVIAMGERVVVPGEVRGGR